VPGSYDSGLDKDVVNELFKSEDMREYVIEKFDSLSHSELTWLVYCAPISIFRKKELLTALGNVGAESGKWSELMDISASVLQLKEATLFQIQKYFVGNDGVRNRFLLENVSFNKYEEVSEYIKLQDDEAQKYIYIIEVDSCRNIKGKYYSGKLFWCVNGEVCCAGYDNQGIDYAYKAYDIYSPFKIGDIVKVDCRPYAKTRHFLLLSSGDEKKGIPAALFLDKGGRIKSIKAVIGEFRVSPIPFLYDAKVCEELPGIEGGLFATISKWLKTDRKKGKKLIEYLENDLWNGVSKEDIEDFMTTYKTEDKEMPESEEIQKSDEDFGKSWLKGHMILDTIPGLQMMIDAMLNTKKLSVDEAASCREAICKYREKLLNEEVI